MFCRFDASSEKLQCIPKWMMLEIDLEKMLAGFSSGFSTSTPSFVFVLLMFAKR